MTYQCADIKHMIEPEYTQKPYDYYCNCCGAGFDSGFGYASDNAEFFCIYCNSLNSDSFNQYYREQGLGDKEIYSEKSKFREI